MTPLLILGACALPLLCAIAILAFRSPLKVVLPIYAALVPFGSGIALPIGIPPPFNTLTTLAGIGVIVTLGLHLLFVESGRKLHPSIPVWLIFTGLNGLTFLWSIDRGATFDRFVILMSLVALYVVVLLVPITRDDLERFRDGIVAGGTAACAYGFFLLLTGNLPEEKAGIPRFSIAGGVGDAADPNITAAVLILPLVIAVSRVLRGAALMRIAHLVAAVLISTGLLLTASRGGILAAALAIFVLIAHERRRALIIGAALFLVVMIVAAGAVLAPDQIERLDQPGSSGRTNIWRVGAIACERWCLTGSGLNTFPEVHRETLLSTAQATGARLGEPPHNVWLGAAVELGIAGVVLLAAGIVVTLLPLRSLPRLRRAAPLAATIGVLAANFFLANFYFKYFWLVLLYAAFEALAPVADETPPTATPPSLPLLASSPSSTPSPALEPV